MSVKVFNAETILEHRKAKAGVPLAVVFDGKRDANRRDVGRKPVKAVRGSKEWEAKTPEERMLELQALRMQVINQADPPSQATIEDFFGRFFIEVQRRANEAGDMTSFIAREETNFDFPEIVYLRDLLPFRGQMLEVSGSNDPVPLIEQQTGNLKTLTIKSWAVGWKDSLKNQLFNQFFSMDKVVQAAVDAWTDNRNKLTVGVIVGATYVSGQTVAAGSGGTLDENTYETLRDAIQTLKELLDPQTERKIAVPAITILCNSSDTWQIQRVVNGQLENNGGGARGNIVAALPIATIIEYDQGINDGFTVGNTAMSFPGVTQGTFFMFVKGIAIVANKRPLSMESSVGSALVLSTEERAWYHCQGESFEDFLGSSYPGTDLDPGFGFIVKGTLPTS